MSLFLFKRLITLIATLVGASVVVFLVLEILPGNAAQILMGPDASPEAVQALAVKLGIDQPAVERYWHWVSGMLVGDLGLSYAYSTSVSEIVLERLTLTVPLALMAMSITTVLALVAGIYAAARHNKLGDVGVMGLSQIGIAIPNFWFAILLILLFSVHLKWFSAGGFPGWDEGHPAGHQGAASCRPSRWPWCSRRSWRASRARPCWRCCARTSCARPVPRVSRGAARCGATCCATR